MKIHPKQTKTGQDQGIFLRWETIMKIHETIRKIHETVMKINKTIREIHESAMKIHETIRKIHETVMKIHGNIRKIHRKQTKIGRDWRNSISLLDCAATARSSNARKEILLRTNSYVLKFQYSPCLLSVPISGRFSWQEYSCMSFFGTQSSCNSSFLSYLLDLINWQDALSTWFLPNM